MAHKVLAAGHEVEIPQAIAAEGRGAVRAYLHAQLFEPRSVELEDGETKELEPLLEPDPRSLTVGELKQELEGIDDPGLLGALRAVEERSTAREAIEARARELRGEAEEEPAEGEEA